MPTSKSASLLAVLLYSLSLIRCTSAECWTCQVDDDCLINDENNPAGASIRSNNNTTTSISLQTRICDQDLQLCVNRDTNLRDIDCPCSNGEDCESGRCEGIDILLQGTCQPGLENNEECNEDDMDCPACWPAPSPPCVLMHRNAGN